MNDVGLVEMRTLLAMSGTIAAAKVASALSNEVRMDWCQPGVLPRVPRDVAVVPVVPKDKVLALSWSIKEVPKLKWKRGVGSTPRVLLMRATKERPREIEEFINRKLGLKWTLEKEEISVTNAASFALEGLNFKVSSVGEIFLKESEVGEDKMGFGDRISGGAGRRSKASERSDITRSGSSRNAEHRRSVSRVLPQVQAADLPIAVATLPGMAETRLQTVSAAPEEAALPLGETADSVTDSGETRSEIVAAVPAAEDLGEVSALQDARATATDSDLAIVPVAQRTVPRFNLEHSWLSTGAPARAPNFTWAMFEGDAPLRVHVPQAALIDLPTARSEAMNLTGDDVNTESPPGGGIISMPSQTRASQYQLSDLRWQRGGVDKFAGIRWEDRAPIIRLVNAFKPETRPESEPFTPVAEDVVEFSPLQDAGAPVTDSDLAIVPVAQRAVPRFNLELSLLWNGAPARAPNFNWAMFEGDVHLWVHVPQAIFPREVGQSAVINNGVTPIGKPIMDEIRRIGDKKDKFAEIRWEVNANRGIGSSGDSQYEILSVDEDASFSRRRNPRAPLLAPKNSPQESLSHVKMAMAASVASVYGVTVTLPGVIHSLHAWGVIGDSHKLMEVLNNVKSPVLQGVNKLFTECLGNNPAAIMPVAMLPLIAVSALAVYQLVKMLREERVEKDASAAAAKA